MATETNEQRILKESVSEIGFSLAYHNSAQAGKFVPPEGLGAIDLGFPDILVPTSKFFVYDRERIEVLLVPGGERNRGFNSSIAEGGYKVIGGSEFTVAYRAKPFQSKAS